MNLTDVDTFAIPLAQSAGLADLEARWRYQLMMQGETNSGVGLAQMRPFVELQRRRLKFAELGSQLEQFAPRVEPLQRYSVWIAAADAYRSAGDVENELRVLAAISPIYVNGDRSSADSSNQLLTRRPQNLYNGARTGAHGARKPRILWSPTAIRRLLMHWCHPAGVLVRRYGRGHTIPWSDSILQNQSQR